MHRFYFRSNDGSEHHISRSRSSEGRMLDGDPRSLTRTSSPRAFRTLSSLALFETARCKRQAPAESSRARTPLETPKSSELHSSNGHRGTFSFVECQSATRMQIFCRPGVAESCQLDKLSKIGYTRCSRLEGIFNV